MHTNEGMTKFYSIEERGKRSHLTSLRVHSLFFPDSVAQFHYLDCFAIVVMFAPSDKTHQNRHTQAVTHVLVAHLRRSRARSSTT